MTQDNAREKQVQLLNDIQRIIGADEPGNAVEVVRYIEHREAGYQAGSEGRWVPVIDRLPDSDATANGCEVVLVTVRTPDGMHHVNLMRHGDTLRDNGFSLADAGFTSDVSTVTAWMPLPSAYKED